MMFARNIEENDFFGVFCVSIVVDLRKNLKKSYEYIVSCDRTAIIRDQKA